MALWKWTFRALLACLPLASLAALSGCNPAALAMMLMPFSDNMEQPRCKLASPREEKTIAVVTWFGNSEMQLYSELVPTADELSEKLVAILRERYKVSREQVKVVPSAQVRVYQNKLTSKSWSPVQIGKQVKADYVIALEINRLSLHERGSSNMLLRGSTEIAVKVYDVAKQPGEQVIFDEIYNRTYPKDNPIDAGGSIIGFRSLYLTHVARELSRWFAAYSHDERTIYSMESD
jgi:hypothetical protein